MTSLPELKADRFTIKAVEYRDRCGSAGLVILNPETGKPTNILRGFRLPTRPVSPFCLEGR
jgi:hypothetical protein